ncbi:MAG TPA: hypothetical protein VK400_16270 [Pyrinomonadaceae bacterium]|nr:hypothetical protein [Pyrinomonadaceae bacterium]
MADAAMELTPEKASFNHRRKINMPTRSEEEIAEDRADLESSLEALANIELKCCECDCKAFLPQAFPPSTKCRRKGCRHQFDNHGCS